MRGLLGHSLASAWHGFHRHARYGFVNVTGLAFGFTAALLIAVYVADELSYDRWIPGHDRIYQVAAGQPGQPTFGVGPSDLGLWLDLDFPELDAVTRQFISPHVLERGALRSNEPVAWVDSNFFEIFDLPVIAGELRSALDRPDSLVLTQTTAAKYFGDATALGETIVLDDEQPMIVRAIIDDLPTNTHLSLRVVAPGHAIFSPAAEQDRSPLEFFGQKLWGTRTYARLAPNSSIDTVIAGLPAMLDRRGGSGGPRKPSDIYALTVRPIADIHLSPGIPGGPGTDLSRIRMFTAIALLIVAGAVINFINLTTALGTRRFVEIGIRKAMGARRRDLIVQFMSEAFVYVFCGALAAIVFASLLLPLLNAFLLRHIETTALLTPTIILGGSGLCFLTAVVAGSYPSLVLSKPPPALVLKARAGLGESRIRQGLVVVQFSVLLTLLIATGAIYGQLRFGIQEALRTEGTQVLNIRAFCADSLRAELEALDGVTGVACSMFMTQLSQGPGTGIVRTNDNNETRLPVNYSAVDPGYFPLYGIRLTAGRPLSTDRGIDRSPADNQWTAPESILVNERAATGLGFATPGDAVGQTVVWNHLYRLPSTFTGDHVAEIVGVIENFQMGRVDSDYRAAAFFYDPAQLDVISVRLDGRRIPETVAAIDAVWNASGASGPISRQFFSDAVRLIYRDLSRQAQLFAGFAFVAILIAILGLIGMAAHESERRTKEVGIRKVVGSTRAGVVGHLVWQFCQPVLIANIVAWPLAYLAMSAWLEKFERRISLDVTLFLSAAALTLFVAAATVFLQSFRAASVRPAQALRDE